MQTEFFKSLDFEFEGDASLWKNNSELNMAFIEFITSPNNPDGQLKKAVLQGSSVKTIHDHAYYWPHFTAIPAPADEDLMIFTISKLTGHAGSRFGYQNQTKSLFYLISSHEKITFHLMRMSREMKWVAGIRTT